MLVFRRTTALCVLLYTSVVLSVGSTTALAAGSVPWDWARAQIEREDPKLIALIDRLFDIHHVGGAVRPLRGDHAGERLPPYEFRAKARSGAGDYSLIITFEPSGREDKSWSARIERRWY